MNFFLPSHAHTHMLSLDWVSRRWVALLAIRGSCIQRWMGHLWPKRQLGKIPGFVYARPLLLPFPEEQL